MAPSVPAILTGNLPSVYPGPQSVGYVSVRNLPRQPYLVPSPRYAQGSGGGRDGKEVLGVREVGYAVFYPCEESKKGWWGSPSVAWLIRPVHTTLAGYAKFANNHPLIRVVYPIMRVLGSRLEVPVHPLAPLKVTVPSTLSPTATVPRIPLVIFSHGLAGMHTAYSHFCASLASQGYVVLAVGHRDGSGPAYIVRPQEDGAEEGVRGEAIETMYIQAKELDWSPSRAPSGNDHLRALQLDMRVSEVYEAYDSFRSLVTSGLRGLRGPDIDIEDGKPSGTMDDFISTFRDRVEVDRGVTIAGHSFGGGTLFSLLQAAPPKLFARIPLSQAIALDPWVDPLPMPAPPTGSKEDKPDVPLLVINSEGFTLWRTHFRRVLGLVKDAGGSFVTIVGCDHQSFSDFPMLVNAAPALTLLSTIHELSYAFLHNTFRDAPPVAGKSPDNGHIKTRREGKPGHEKEKMVGEFGEVVVHLVAEEGRSKA